MSLFSILRRMLEIIIRKRGEIYYINGPETLPAPLGAEEEARGVE